MLYIAAALVLLIAYFVQKKLFEKYTFDQLVYRARLDKTEATVGDDVYLYEELINEKALPLPYIKVTTALPEGLAFHLITAEGQKRSDHYTGAIESMFVMKGRQKISRRWRISCKKRGVYSLDQVLIVAGDLIGFNMISQNVTMPEGKSSTVTVLPRAVDLERDFTSTRYFSGDIVTNQSLLTDPMLRSGARDYTPLDPMNKINWKLTAAHGHLMVNVEEYVQKIQSNIILNCCSQMIERDSEVPSNPEFIEYNITVAASLLERFLSDNIPVRLIANTDPAALAPDCKADESETGQKILVTEPFCGKQGLLEAMQMLARFPMRFSMPIEKLLDFILENPHKFAENGNIVLITSVLDERMMVFREQMASRGIEVIFYATTSNRGIQTVPAGAKVFFRTYFDSYKVGI